MTEQDETTQHDPAWRSIHLLAPLFRQHWRRVAAGFAALACVDFLQLWIPRIIKDAIDSMDAGTASGKTLLLSAGLILLLALVIAVLRFAWRYLILGFSRILERDTRNNMLSHLLGLDRIFFSRRPPGEIMALSTNDMAAVQLASGMGLVAFVDAIFMTVAALIFMATLNPLLTAIAVAPMPVLALVTRILAKRLHKRFKLVQEQFSKLTEFTRHTIQSIHLIKAYTQETAQEQRFDRMGEAYIDHNIGLSIVQGALFPFSGLTANVSLLLVLFYGGRLAISGTITLGDFAAFIAYLFMLTWPMMALGWVADLFQRGATSLRRIEELFVERPALKDSPGAERLSHVRGALELRQITFTYPGATQPALRQLSLSIEPGQILGIVGRTGSGKSTLCSLIGRMYPVEDETVYLDGHDFNRLTLTTVRNAIAMVPQNVVLFSDTIAANIALGSPSADQHTIETVAKAAAIHDEIMAMEDGYSTRIGERGVRLSGGQRQRIALARALLLDRPILIIDDGLSAVDTETEHAIIDSIANYLKDRTCIIVSHRVAPLINADTIVVMDHGQVVARAPHAVLQKQNAFYAAIYEHQTAQITCGG